MSANETKKDDEGSLMSHRHPNRRVKNMLIYKPIVVGTISMAQGKKGQKDQLFAWCCYVRGANNEGIAHFVKKVVFTLHPTFKNNVRTVEEPPFEIQEQGWGEFEITVRIHFVDSSEKPVEIIHFLKLFNEDKTSQTPRKPIVSEQYDEIVFSEPTVAPPECNPCS